MSSIEEVVQTVKHPRSHSQAVDHDIAIKFDAHETIQIDSSLQDSSEIKHFKSPGRMTISLDAKRESSRMSSWKPGRSSSTG